MSPRSGYIFIFIERLMIEGMWSFLMMREVCFNMGVCHCVVKV